MLAFIGYLNSLLRPLSNMAAADSVEDLAVWKARAVPTAEVLDGRYARLEKLSVSVHSDLGLFDAVVGPVDAETRFKYMLDDAPTTREDFLARMKSKEDAIDRQYFATIDKSTGRVGGYIAVQSIVPQHGTFEIGSVYMGPSIARSRVATETIYLLLRYAFRDLKYRRVEWKCNNENAKSKAAALRFGFQYEGLFRNHMVTKGLNRDTAWYSITDDDWAQGVEASYVAWLDDANFTDDGLQINKLISFRA